MRGRQLAWLKTVGVVEIEVEDAATLVAHERVARRGGARCEGVPTLVLMARDAPPTRCLSQTREEREGKA